MRLFYALPFPLSVREKLVQIQQKISKGSQSASLTSFENLHLTLAFLGEVDIESVGPLCELLKGMDYPPFEITLTHLGNFRHDIWWVGIEKNNHLLELQRELVASLSSLNFPIDTREFTPHITLARRVKKGTYEGPITPIKSTIDTISLMESKRISSKLVYNPLCSQTFSNK